MGPGSLDCSLLCAETLMFILGKYSADVIRNKELYCEGIALF